ncbi:MAG: group II intron reverse transcriptase/maturase [Deltaproteobacteria bacterium]|nr:group II intron reverse transcriptase/maturase [Deltaproteobacteria bacterium]
MGDTSRSSTVSTQLQQIAEQAIQYPEMVFTTLAHLLDEPFLREAHRRINKKSASGIDKVTAKMYAETLEDNLRDLHERLKSGRYKAPPFERVWIDKEPGKQRPIGIPTFEDKIVQRAVEMLLSAIYEQTFYSFSHGFRRGHSQHKALHELRESCREHNINWIISADITGLFDNIDHGLLQDIIRQKVNDGRLMSLIGKWLHAGVMEGGKVEYSEKGTPQGGVISPVLSNIFLHEVLDDWYAKEVRSRMRGGGCIIRWADDFILGFELEADAKRVMEVLPKRFDRFGLELHPEKTKLIPFSKPSPKRNGQKKPGTFDFLGFTFYWGRTLQGYYVIKKKTARKRLNRFLRMLWNWCKGNRHDPIAVQYRILCSKLRGFYQYYGVRGNYKALEVAFEFCEKSWRRWLSRRSQKGTVLFEDLRKCFPLPLPRIVHNI